MGPGPRLRQQVARSQAAQAPALVPPEVRSELPRLWQQTVGEAQGLALEQPEARSAWPCLQ